MTAEKVHFLALDLSATKEATRVAHVETSHGGLLHTDERFLF